MNPTGPAADKKITAWFHSPAYQKAFEGSGSRASHKDRPDAEMIALAQAAAKISGMPESWANPPYRAGAGRGKSESHGNYSLECALSKSGAAKGAQACWDAGLDPWLELENRGWEYGKGTVKLGLGLMQPRDMALIAAKCPSSAAAVVLVKQAAQRALDHGEEHAKNFAGAVGRQFIQAADSSLQGAAGIMGTLDRKAKHWALILSECEGELLAIAKTAVAKSAISECAEQARALLKIKEMAAAFDPAKFKKNMEPHQRARLATLGLLSEQCSEDDEAAAQMIGLTPWLASEPHALCVGIKGRDSVLSNALKGGGEKTLAAIEALGSNIWIAAAQASQPNACEWAVGACCWGRAQSSSGILARMLAYGAHLDGAADPIQYALDKLDIARKDTEFLDGDPKRWRAACGQFKAEIEAIAIKELLASRGAQASAAPASRRSRL